MGDDARAGDAVSETTGIQWTDATWRRSVHVVAGDECARPTRGVEACEAFAAAATADDHRVRLALLPSQRIPAAFVFDAMHRLRRKDRNVKRSVVGFVAIDMVNYLAGTKLASDLRLSYKPVFVDVAANICEPMPWPSQKDVAVRRDGASAPPVRIALSWMNNSHSFRITRGLPWR